MLVALAPAVSVSQCVSASLACGVSFARRAMRKCRVRNERESRCVCVVCTFRAGLAVCPLWLYTLFMTQKRYNKFDAPFLAQFLQTTIGTNGLQMLLENTGLTCSDTPQQEKTANIDLAWRENQAC